MNDEIKKDQRFEKMVTVLIAIQVPPVSTVTELLTPLRVDAALRNVALVMVTALLVPVPPMSAPACSY